LRHDAGGNAFLRVIRSLNRVASAGAMRITRFGRFDDFVDDGAANFFVRPIWQRRFVYRRLLVYGRRDVLLHGALDVPDLATEPTEEAVRFLCHLAGTIARRKRRG